MLSVMRKIHISFGSEDIYASFLSFENRWESMAYPFQTGQAVLNSWDVLSNLDHYEKQTRYQIFLVKVVNKCH